MSQCNFYAKLVVWNRNRISTQSADVSVQSVRERKFEARTMTMESKIKPAAEASLAPSEEYTKTLIMDGM